MRRLTRAELMNPARPLVCVDLNGVLDRYTGWKSPTHWDPPRNGARQFLADLRAHGFDIVVFTTRHPAGVRRWLREHGLDEFVAAITDRKPPAHVFVDDRAVCFRGSFRRTLQRVLTFAAHWEVHPGNERGKTSVRAPARARQRRAVSAQARARNSSRLRSKR